MSTDAARASDDDFDLARLLWGELPMVPSQAGERDEDLGNPLPTEDIATNSAPAKKLADARRRDDTVVAEQSPYWDATSPRGQKTTLSAGLKAETRSDAIDTEDLAVDWDPTEDVDLDALASILAF